MGFDFLIYDLDGTLVDSLRDITSSVNFVREDSGLDFLSLNQVRSYIGSGINALMSKAMPNDRGEDCKLNAVEMFKSHYVQHLLDATVVFDGVKEMLDALKDKKKAVLTNKEEIYAREILKKLGIIDNFLEVWGGNTIGVRKPDPKTVLEIAKLTNSELSKSVMIGDSANDFLVAKAAGIASIAVTYGYCDVDQIKKYEPNWVVKDPREIVDIVL
ncbi:MAG: HAD-IA family hydrolase [Endomicrobium sp.]|jgi:phosphoglycolate phosphatase|nr:HAD-IA family hydrolase [Endomicrobium sp.]